MTKSKFSINLKDGRLVFRNDEVDEQIIYHPIPDSVAMAIKKGKVTPARVIEACEKRLKEKGEMTYTEYMKKKELLNMRTKNVTPPESRPQIEEKRADEMISLADLGIGVASGKKEKDPPSDKKEEAPSKADAPATTDKSSKKNMSLNF